MEINMKVIIKKIKGMVLENLKERILNILVIGKVENFMDKDILKLKIILNIMVNGKMENNMETDGLKLNRLNILYSELSKMDFYMEELEKEQMIILKFITNLIKMY